MILNRYIAREITRPMLIIGGVILAIFFSYITAGYLSDAVVGNLPADYVLLLIFLKMFVAQEIILPTTLYLAVVIAVGRMYRDSEVLAIQSCGVADINIVKPVFYLSLIVAAIVAVVSLYIRPWAYGKLYWLKTHAELNFDLSNMEGGKFYEIPSASLVVFAENIDHDENRGSQVFILGDEDDTLQVILAEAVDQYEDPSSQEKVLMLQNGSIYEISKNDEKARVTEFFDAKYAITPESEVPQRYRRKAASTVHLLSSDSLEDIAELQWRLSTPLSALLLGLLGVLLSRTTPRQGKYGKVITAIVLFAVYYNMTVVVKNMVGNGIIRPYPGVGLVQLALASLVGTLFWYQGMIRLHRLR
jgi:lipopolysaccharide export system permease protein